MSKRNHFQERPRLDITPDYWDQVMDYASWGLCIILIGLAIYLYTLPADVIEDTDFRMSVLFLSLLGPGMTIGFHYLKKYPHSFNYMVRITPENAARQYRLALRMIRMINLVILVEFIGILIMTYYEKALHVQMNIGMIVIAVMILGFLPVGYYLWKSMEKPG